MTNAIEPFDNGTPSTRRPEPSRAFGPRPPEDLRDPDPSNDWIAT